MKKQCENCESSVEHFNIDYDEGLIRCFYCSHTLPTEIFFNDVTVNKFAKKLLKANLIDFVGSDCHNALQANEIRKTLNSKMLKILKSQPLFQWLTQAAAPGGQRPCS